MHYDAINSVSTMAHELCGFLTQATAAAIVTHLGVYVRLTIVEWLFFFFSFSPGVENKGLSIIIISGEYYHN